MHFEFQTKIYIIIPVAGSLFYRKRSSHDVVLDFSVIKISAFKLVADDFKKTAPAPKWQVAEFTDTCQYVNARRHIDASLTK